MFKNILMIDNFDSFTFNLVDYIKQQGANVVVYRNDVDTSIIDEVDPDLIVLSPGPSVPNNAGNLLAIIEKAYRLHPIFGVCLGMEALIEFFGGSLKFIDPVHGKASPISHDGKTIFQDLKQNFMAGRYHSLVADQVPACFEVSATLTEKNSPLKNHDQEKKQNYRRLNANKQVIMGIRHNTLPIEAVQFHPESVLTMKNKSGMKMIENLIHKHMTNV